ncbi:MAG: hypothetical protein GXP09_12855 [Gammaproteobacteria bacterium]|nr:hypothetical protein [Gammaproteobacteria bacterium]
MKKGEKSISHAPSSQDDTYIRLGSAFVDEGAKKVFVFSEDILINQLRRDGPIIEKSFDQLCESELRQFSSLISQTSGLLYSGLRLASQQEDELRKACAQLLLNASNSFAASVAVLRMGYVLQPGIIIRSLLEAVSTTLHLLQKPSDFSAYQNHTLQSPKTIALAKKALPPFGILYGHFSDNFAHIGRLHKSITPITEYTERDEALKLNLSSLRIASWLLYVTTELVFNELVSSPRYWHPVENGYQYAPSEEEKNWFTKYFEL